MRDRIQFVMISNRDEGRQRLAAAGIKPTFQRIAILEAVAGRDGHPSVRDLHQRLLRDVPTLSKTTLYSTLDLFARKGLIASLYIDPAEVRYDGISSPHHHFACTTCGSIFDIDITCATGRCGRIHGHRIDEVHGYFKGLCRDCLAAGRSPRPAHVPNHKSPRRKTHA
jgi:Fur family transcriptional regulator, peroxide stress response regulator